MTTTIPSTIITPSLPQPYSSALALIDTTHLTDPRPCPSAPSLPYELYYAHLMTRTLMAHTPEASPLLHLAIRAQHLRRWEIPRSTYPDGKAGYLNWRAAMKKRQAALAREICLDARMEEGEAEHVARLVNKEGHGRAIKKPPEERTKEDEEVVALEDVACLVFLEEGLEGFHVKEEVGGGEGKVVGILRKTWAKMGERGREMAVQMVERRDGMGDRAKGLVKKALGDKTES